MSFNRYRNFFFTLFIQYIFIESLHGSRHREGCTKCKYSLSDIGWILLDCSLTDIEDGERSDFSARLGWYEIKCA